MMELRCVLVVTLVSLGAATPHGYGVKGGASARAESSASAGAFGGGELPVAIPLGAGYSGSFTKSSSASSSSSSASSSSSSSSFSYTGSGAGGFLGFGSNGGSGCTSGNCQGAVHNGIAADASGGAGAGSQGYSAAKAVASAGAVAGAGPGCQGSTCGINNAKCVSGQCEPKAETIPSSVDSISNDKDKCTSGQCGLTSQIGGSSTENSDHDIRVVSSSSGFPKKVSTDDKTTAFTDTETECSSGNCGPITSASAKPIYSTGGSNTYESASATSTQHTTGSGYRVPTTELETPKLDSTLPSSYNVPIHGSYDHSGPKSSCDGGKCDNHLKGIPSSSNSITPINYLIPPAITNPSSPNCEGSNCVGGLTRPIASEPIQVTNIGTVAGSNAQSNYGKPIVSTKPVNDDAPTYTGGFGGPPGIFQPNEFNSPATLNPSHPNLSTPTNSASSFGPGCTSPSCAPHSLPSGTHEPSGSFGVQKPNKDDINFNEKHPLYTGGFGGPDGVLKPNEYNVQSPVTPTNKPIIPSYNTHVPSSNAAPAAGCTSPNCNSYPGSLVTLKPNSGSIPSKEDLPPYTGGFGGPSGILNPNEYDIHSPVSSSPGNSPSGTSPHIIPTTANNPAGCTTPNCSPSVHVGSNSQAASFGVSKPIVGVHISGPPEYTSGSGTTKPSDVSPAITSISQSYAPPQLSTGSYSTGCKTGNCGNFPSGTTLPTAIPASIGNSSPNTGNYPTTSVGSDLTGCTSGNCDNYQTSDANANAAANTLIGSSNIENSNVVKHQSPIPGTGCKTGNCGNYPIGNAPTAAHVPSGSSDIGAPHAEKYPSTSTDGCQTGNCGNYQTSTMNTNVQLGSNNIGKYPTTIGASSSIACKSGNCGDYSNNGANGLARPFDDSAPNGGKFPFVPTGSHSTGCETGNCGDYPTGSAPTAGNPPSGFLGIGGKYPSTPTGSYSSGCKTGNCGDYSAGVTNGANAQFGSSNDGVSNADKYQPSAPTGSYTIGCKTGNCGDYPIGSAPTAGNPPSGFLGIGGKYPSTPTGSYSSGCKTGNCGDYSAGVTNDANVPFGSSNDGVSNSDKYQPSTPTGSYTTGCKTGNCGNFPTSSTPTADDSPSRFLGIGGKYPSTPTGSYSSLCKSGNCGDYQTGSAPTAENSPSGFLGISGKYPSTPTGSYSSGCKTGNCGDNSAGVANDANVPFGSSNDDKYPSTPTGSYSTGCKTGNCGIFPTSSTFAAADVPFVSTDNSAANAGKYPSTPSYSTGCKTGNCGNYPLNGASASAGSESHSQAGSLAHSHTNSPSNDNVPSYTGGFGGPAGLLKPNEYTIPAGGFTPNDQHKSSTTTSSKSNSCSSGNCSVQPSHDASVASSGATSGTHATAAAAAKADAIAYTGGFGGPPGVLKPYDDGKTGAALTSGGSHYGGSNANIHSTHDAHTGLVNGAPNNIGTSDQLGSHGSSAAGSSAFSAAGASSGYNVDGAYHNHGGNTKGSSPCGGGCGGGDSNGAHGHAGATAKSLSGASSFGFGGGFASSSASAHASAGAYTKGGYGRR